MVPALPTVRAYWESMLISHLPGLQENKWEKQEASVTQGQGDQQGPVRDDLSQHRGKQRGR